MHFPETPSNLNTIYFQLVLKFSILLIFCRTLVLCCFGLMPTYVFGSKGSVDSSFVCVASCTQWVPQIHLCHCGKNLAMQQKYFRGSKKNWSWWQFGVATKDFYVVGVSPKFWGGRGNKLFLGVGVFCSVRKPNLF